ncbi:MULTISPECIES: hypothetical protein [Mycobacteriaceae]|uniref:hypothetical protein n=1 Tax=Mycobacteriaceae TaxID=1762 RepID=UPI001BB34863|nr:MULTISPECIES: hypothetical protein [unclassified Mycolicibacterium]
MARAQAVFPGKLFNDEGFRALSSGPQRLLMWLWVHPDLSMAGTIGIHFSEWASATGDLDELTIVADLHTLKEAGWIDHDQGQLWIRPFLDLDGAARGGPQKYASVARALTGLRSQRLRQSAYQQFRKYPPPLRDIPSDDDKAAANAAKWNTSVSRALAEFEASMLTRGVLEDISDTPSDISYAIPHPIPPSEHEHVHEHVVEDDAEPLCTACGSDIEPERRTPASHRHDLCMRCWTTEFPQHGKVTAW